MSLFFSKLWLRMSAFVAIVLGMKRRGLHFYESMVAIDPSDTLARVTVGNLRMELGDAAGAADAFSRLLEHKPDHAESWFNLGYVQEQRDNLVEAERCFRRAVELEATLDRAWYGLALVQIRTGELAQAVHALEKNIKLQPFSPYGYYQLAMTQHHLGDSDAAWRTYEQLKNFEPRYAATLKRDLENTRPRSRPQQSPPSESDAGKEVLPAST